MKKFPVCTLNPKSSFGGKKGEDGKNRGIEGKGGRLSIGGRGATVNPVLEIIHLQNVTAPSACIRFLFSLPVPELLFSVEFHEEIQKTPWSKGSPHDCPRTTRFPQTWNPRDPR